MRACIPYGQQEKDEPVILKDVEGKRINVIGVMNVRNELYYEQHEKNMALPPTVWKVYNSNTTVGGGVCG